jgi:DNA-binding protein
MAKKIKGKKSSIKNTKTPKKIMVKKNINRTSFISKAPVKRLMKQEGARLISDGALKLLISKLEQIATKTTKKAMSLVKDEKRKRLTSEDIAWAANFPD